MTQPALAYQVRGMGRMYSFPPKDLSHLEVKRGGISLYDVPATTAMMPSVTNITGLLSKEGLFYYYGSHAVRGFAACECSKLGGIAVHHHPCDCVHARTGKPVKGCKDKANHCARDCNLNDVEHSVLEHRMDANKHRDQRAEEGTRAHTIAEVLTVDAPLPKNISEMDEAYADAFMAWWSEYDVEPVFTEQTVAWIDATNPKIGYAGTADGFGYLKGHEGLQVYDFKSKAGAPDDSKIKRYGLAYEENRLQLAALAQAQYRYVEQDGGWGYDDMPVVAGGMVVALYESGDFRVEHVPGESLTQAGAAFIGLLVARRWQLGFDVAQEVMW